MVSESRPRISTDKGKVKNWRVLHTIVAYLLGQIKDRELINDSSMLKRLSVIAKFPEQDKFCILYTYNAMINKVKLYSIL